MTIVKIYANLFNVENKIANKGVKNGEKYNIIQKDGKCKSKYFSGRVSHDIPQRYEGQDG